MKLKISEVSKRFGDHVALDNVSFEVADVHSLVLIGPSGGGKTTLLRILAGLETPDGGEVRVNEERVDFRESALRRYRRTVGVVFQAFNLFPHLTALENISLPLERVHAHSRADATEIGMQLLRKFQLETHASKRPAALSGGQRQRVAIARAIAIKPKLVLFDEPTSALDPEMTGEVLDTIEQLREEGTDLILVTHEMGFARIAADRTAFLSNGRILEFGKTQSIFDNPQADQCRRFLAKVLKY